MDCSRHKARCIVCIVGIWYIFVKYVTNDDNVSKHMYTYILYTWLMYEIISLMEVKKKKVDSRAHNKNVLWIAQHVPSWIL